MINDNERKHRLQLELTDVEFERLERLVERIGAHSKAECFRRALSLYECLLDHHNEGYKLFAVGPDGERKEVVIIGLNY